MLDDELFLNGLLFFIEVAKLPFFPAGVVMFLRKTCGVA